MKEENKKDIQTNDSKDIIVVGIGASAGGLEALQDFFKNMPLTTGLAFVVIQHLSPDYKSVMDELLARQTTIPIHIITDGLQVEADNIYLIPPRKNLSIFHNKLYLEEQSIKKRLNLPVDIFFRSLAVENGKNTIGIILSGTGSDGMLGTKAIKEAGGIVMVQDEQTAKFDGMPRSSISTGLVDYILPPSKMPEALVNYIKHPFVKTNKSLENVLSENIDTLTKIIIILRDFSGIDFSYYKENTIIRRLERRVSINRFDTLEEYLIFLSESDKEKDILYRELLIGVTRFFRDSEAFESISKNILPFISKKKSIRIWSAGCSTGEEVYSLAILINECLEKNNFECEVKIFATDIDRYSIELAGQGFYSDSVVADMDPLYLTKYFNRKENGYQINDTIRKNIVFATHNLLKDSPFSKLDLIVCRNLFIYFKPEVQTKLLSMFYYSISPDGFLFMGSSESLGDMNEAFDCLDIKWKIYKYKSGYKLPIIKELFASKNSVYENDRNNTIKLKYINGIKFEKLTNSIISMFLPPSVIVDENDNILHTINDVSSFVKIQPGNFSQNLLNNLPHELSLFVSTLLRKLKKDEKTVILESLVSIKGFDSQKITIEGRVLNIERTVFYIISFKTEERIDFKKDESYKISLSIDEQYLSKVTDLEKELQFTKESLQATVEELETSNEELQSSNEELIASNEELQSTNEEFQSVNEELYTVNSEYQVKIEELTRLNNDVTNLLKNTEVGALYLDRNLCIRKITPLVSQITNILQSDVGRPISHISITNENNLILEDILNVVENLQPIDREIKLNNNLIYFVRTRPYRTDYNAVEGILITFFDISTLKKESNRANIASNRLFEALKIGNMAWWEWGVKTGKVLFDERKATMLGYTIDEFPKDVYKICDLIHSDDYGTTMQAMENYIRGITDSWDITYRIRRKDGTYAWYYDVGKITETTKEGVPLKLVGTVIEVSKLKNLENELIKNKELFEKMITNSPIAQVLTEKNGHIIFGNKKALEIFNITFEQITNRSYNSKEWEITDLNGKIIDSENLPFYIIKKTKKPLYNYKHFISVSGKKRILLTICGTPIINKNNEFEGVVFTIGVAENE